MMSRAQQYSYEKNAKCLSIEEPQNVIICKKKFRVVDFLGCAETRVNFGAAQ